MGAAAQRRAVPRQAAAAGVAVFGSTELALRAANAVWFTGTALLVGLLGARFWGRRAGPLATLAYAVMLAPFLAANVLTPDTVLTFWVTAMAYAYWRSHSAEGRREESVWIVAAGVCAGFGFLAKGPALLVFALPLVLHGLILRGFAAWLRLDVVAAALLGLILGGSWYAAVAQLLPGAAAYFFDNQVAGRLWAEHYGRNAGWLGPIQVYLPALIAGSLPWTGLLCGSASRLVRSLRRSGWSSLRQRPTALLILLWVAVPLVVLSLARSRLPFYILPLMPALGLAATERLRHVRLNPRSPTRRAWLPRAAAWIVLLVAIKAAVAYWPSASDTRRLAASLSRLDVDPAARIVAVDLKRNALPFYGYRDLIQVRWRTRLYPFYSPPPTLEAVLSAGVGGSDPEERVFLVRTGQAPDLLAELQAKRQSCRSLGSTMETVVVGCVRSSKVEARGPAFEQPPAQAGDRGRQVAGGAGP